MRNKELIENKLTAIGLIGLGILSGIISKDWTACVFTTVLGTSVLFSKENEIYH